jgi:hypothetical protein
MNDNLYQNFHKRWQEVMLLPPQHMGPLTPVYKRLVPYLKTAPWRILIPIALFLIALSMLLTNFTAAQVTSILQKAF